MASLDADKKKKIRKNRMKYSILFWSISTIISMYMIEIIDRILLGKNLDLDKIKISNIFMISKFIFGNSALFQIFLLIQIIVVVLLICYIIDFKEEVKNTTTIKVTNKIEIPASVGQGQHGTARFLKKQEKDELFKIIQIKNGIVDKKDREENLGIIVSTNITSQGEMISCVNDDLHSIIIGSTRSGKTRGIILQSIWLRGQTNGSMVVSDPKGELYLYTHDFLKKQGYEVIALDFRQPLKSFKYNYLDEINRAVDIGDIALAVDYTWDLVSILVGTPKGEPIWTNGESAVIAAGILAISMEAPKEYRNMANVYHFLSTMCKENEFGEMPITEFLDKLPSEHPAKMVFAVALLSPSRTRASFVSSALATLRLFCNLNVASMTSQSDFNLEEIGKKSTALFIIVPDEKTTLYSLVSIFINQVYTSLVKIANVSGGRLPVTVEFLLDEFGNFPAIPSFGSMLSVGAGRGLRFNLVLQDYQQLEKHYKDDFENIKGNCVLTIYLKTTSLKTLEELSKKTGTYTVQASSVSDSLGYNGKSSSVSSSANMQSRALLTPDEIGRIERPYALVMLGGNFPGIFQLPDLSKYYANKQLGLGDKKHNERVIIERDEKRKKRTLEKIDLWKILEEVEEKTERVSFLK